MRTPAVSSDSSGITPQRMDWPYDAARSGTDGGKTGWRRRSTAIQPPLAYVAGEGLAFVDGCVRVAHDGRKRVHDVARGIALPAEVPGHADLVHTPAVDLQRPQALGHERFGLDLASCRRDHHPVQVANALLARQLRRDLGEALRLKLGRAG